MDSYKDLLNNLIKNVDKKPVKNIDLILDSGGFKGVYLYGALLYLKEIEKVYKN